jgi:hypothetical protein
MTPETPERQLLRRLMLAFDTDDNMDFLAATVAARKMLGLKLADYDEAATDEAVLLANGYTVDGEPTDG